MIKLLRVTWRDVTRPVCVMCHFWPKGGMSSGWTHQATRESYHVTDTHNVMYPWCAPMETITAWLIFSLLKLDNVSRYCSSSYLDSHFFLKRKSLVSLIYRYYLTYTKMLWPMGYSQAINSLKLWCTNAKCHTILEFFETKDGLGIIFKWSLLK